jgi:molybdate transport system regulatory protein
VLAIGARAWDAGAMAGDVVIKALLQLKRGSASGVGAERIRLLETIHAKGSISAAAGAVGLSYKGAWDAVQALNNLFAQPVVLAQTGGRGGGAASVTSTGRALITAFRRLEGELSSLAARLDSRLASGGDLNDLAWSLGMKTSAGNALRGVVSQFKDGAVNSEVTLTIAPGVDIVAIVTRDSAKALGLAPGREAMALINASVIVLAAGTAPLRTSARNDLAGVVVRCERGAVNDEVVVEIAPGKTLTATVTHESAQALGLVAGASIRALIKAPQVILAVD